MQTVDLGQVWELWIKYNKDDPWHLFQGTHVHHGTLAGDREKVINEWLPIIKHCEQAAIKRSGDFTAEIIKRDNKSWIAERQKLLNSLERF